ncbi:MAG: hypothetical protein OER86_00165 [Phycisphaerae bacterium]|nr:hypothetical protein [Phycisphaerae bacterium]
MGSWEVTGVLVLAGLFAAGAARSGDRPQIYKAKAGSLGVRVHRTFELERAAGGRPLEMRVTWPTAAGRYPLIVFSHGAMGSKDAYDPLVRHWAGHGYVCIQPTHGDALKYQLAGFRSRMNTIWGHWKSRAGDVSMVLDALDKIEAGVPGLAGRIDRSRIGVGGHSFGAHTSMLVGGMTVGGTLGGRAVSLADSRPAALLMISPQGTGGGLDRASWSKLTRPGMFITGTNDKSGRTGKSHAWRKEAFDHSPPGDKYLVLIDGAHHGFGGISGPRRFPGRGPDNADHVAYVCSATTAYWDAYLKKDQKARRFLASEVFTQATGGSVALTRKMGKKSVGP